MVSIPLFGHFLWHTNFENKVLRDSHVISSKDFVLLESSHSKTSSRMSKNSLSVSIRCSKKYAKTDQLRQFKESSKNWQVNTNKCITKASQPRHYISLDPSEKFRTFLIAAHRPRVFLRVYFFQPEKSSTHIQLRQRSSLQSFLSHAPVHEVDELSTEQILRQCRWWFSHNIVEHLEDRHMFRTLITFICTQQTFMT